MLDEEDLNFGDAMGNADPAQRRLQVGRRPAARPGAVCAVLGPTVYAMSTSASL
jgi:hypothetical protein